MMASKLLDLSMQITYQEGSIAAFRPYEIAIALFNYSDSRICCTICTVYVSCGLVNYPYDWYSRQGAQIIIRRKASTVGLVPMAIILINNNCLMLIQFNERQLFGHFSFGPAVEHPSYVRDCFLAAGSHGTYLCIQIGVIMSLLLGNKDWGNLYFFFDLLRGILIVLGVGFVEFGGEFDEGGFVGKQKLDCGLWPF